MNLDNRGEQALWDEDGEAEGRIAKEAEMEHKYLTFWTDDQRYGVSILNVVQIIGIQAITPIPEYPEYAKGIINLRGEIIPIIDARLRLGKREAEYTEKTCIIIANIHSTSIGFIVDSVDEVTNILPEDICRTPQMAGGHAESAFLTGVATVAGNIVLLLDIHKILSVDQAEQLLQDNWDGTETEEV